MKKALICISCPVGCRLTAESDEKGNVSITGNQCERGVLYGSEELLAPKRVVTAVVKTNSRHFTYLPVKTSKPLLKQLIPGLLNTLYSCCVPLPVTSGDILINDYQGTGVNIIFTRGAVE